jgi:glutathione S-transferase
MRLFAMPGTCALAPNIVAVWVGAPVEVVNLTPGENREPAFLAINPKGMVPALEIEPGVILAEAAAVMRYLAAVGTNPSLNPDDPLRWARVDETISYMTSEVHAAYGGHFAPFRFAESEAGQAEVRAATYAKLAAHYARLESNFVANGGDHYLGSRTTADAYLYVLIRWIDSTPLKLDDYPALRAFRAMMQDDAGVRTALARQGMED